MLSHDTECECEVCKNGMAAWQMRLGTLMQSHGCAGIGTAATIEGRAVTMSYTVGLAEKALPELIVFGLPAKTALVLLNSAARLALTDGLPTDVPVIRLATLPVLLQTGRSGRRRRIRSPGL